MKLASLKAGRDGRLVVVSRDLRRAVAVPDIAGTLQQALDDWSDCAPQLAAVYSALNESARDDAMPFETRQCAAPLPRAYQWADGSAYVNHVELVRRARGAAMPERFWHEPLLYQGGSDDLLGACDPVELGDPAWGLDFEAEVAVITDDVARGASVPEAAGAIRLVMLANDISLRGLIPGELAKGFGFYQSKPATSFSPVAVTPDELGEAWRDARVHLPLRSELNGTLFGCPEAGRDMTFSFADLIVHATRTRRLGAGSIIGSGTVSNRHQAGHGSPAAGGDVGHSCIAERRMVETLERGEPLTPFLKDGDRVRLEMLDGGGESVFGAIDQRIEAVPGMSA